MDRRSAANGSRSSRSSSWCAVILLIFIHATILPPFCSGSSSSSPSATTASSSSSLPPPSLQTTKLVASSGGGGSIKTKKADADNNSINKTEDEPISANATATSSSKKGSSSLFWWFVHEVDDDDEKDKNNVERGDDSDERKEGDEKPKKQRALKSPLYARLFRLNDAGGKKEKYNSSSTAETTTKAPWFSGNKSSDSDDDSVSSSSKDEILQKKEEKKKKGKISRRNEKKQNNNNDAEQKKKEDDISDANDTNTQEDDATSSSSSNSTTSSSADTGTNQTTMADNNDEGKNKNQTASSNSMESMMSSLSPMQRHQLQMLQQQQQPGGGGPTGVIVLGSPATRPRGMQQYPHRPGGAMQPLHGSSQGPPAGSGAAYSMGHSMGYSMGEFMATIIGTVGRLWFLTWLARKIASEEESIAPTQHFVWERLNDRFVRDVMALKKAMAKPPRGVSQSRWKRYMRKHQGRKPSHIDNPYPLSNKSGKGVFTKTVIVMELGGNPNDDSSSSSSFFSAGARDQKHLADVVSFLICQHRDHAFGTAKKASTSSSSGPPEEVKPLPLEIVIKVNSPGGAVGSFGLAASQVQRLRAEPGITVTVCVDKYAASGGYMIASQAHKLIAAPFATVGSIGVIMEGFNFHDLLREYGVKPLVLKAGDAKNPITTFGQVSKDDIDTEQQNLQRVHDSFRKLVIKGRPGLKMSIENLNTLDGSVYLGDQAKDLNLVDAVMTSDEYILERIRYGDRVFQLHRSHQSKFSRRLLSPLDVLPHLKTWLSNIRSSILSPSSSAATSFLDTGVSSPFSSELILQLGGIVAFIQYLLKKHNTIHHHNRQQN